MIWNRSELGTDILGCHQAVPTWVTHIRIYEVREDSPADKSCAGQVMGSCKGLCGNASPPSRCTAGLTEGVQRPLNICKSASRWSTLVGAVIKNNLTEQCGHCHPYHWSCKNGSRTFVLSNLYHHVKILLCIVLENGIWESLINTWARIRQGHHLFVKVIEILLLINGPGHCWTINIKA